MFYEHLIPFHQQLGQASNFWVNPWPPPLRQLKTAAPRGHLRRRHRGGHPHGRRAGQRHGVRGLAGDFTEKEKIRWLKVM